MLSILTKNTSLGTSSLIHWERIDELHGWDKKEMKYGIEFYIEKSFWKPINMLKLIQRMDWEIGTCPPTSQEHWCLPQCNLRRIIGTTVHAPKCSKSHAWKFPWVLRLNNRVSLQITVHIRNQHSQRKSSLQAAPAIILMSDVLTVSEPGQ